MNPIKKSTQVKTSWDAIIELTNSDLGYVIIVNCKIIQSKIYIKKVLSNVQRK